MEWIDVASFFHTKIHNGLWVCKRGKLTKQYPRGMPLTQITIMKITHDFKRLSKTTVGTSSFSRGNLMEDVDGERVCLWFQGVH